MVAGLHTLLFGKKQLKYMQNVQIQFINGEEKTDSQNIETNIMLNECKPFRMSRPSHMSAS